MNVFLRWYRLVFALLVLNFIFLSYLACYRLQFLAKNRFKSIQLLFRLHFWCKSKIQFLLTFSKKCICSIQDCIRLQHGTSFHPSCLRCIRCSMAIMSGEKLYMHNDNPLCRVCIAAVRSKQCFACGGAISAQQNRGLQALGKHFHVKCFLCSVRIIA